MWEPRGARFSLEALISKLPGVQDAGNRQRAGRGDGRSWLDEVTPAER
jgi:hypothetical protein